MKNTGLNHIPSVKGYVFNLTVNLIAVAIFYTFLGGRGVVGTVSHVPRV